MKNVRRLVLLISLNLLFSLSVLVGSEKKPLEEINEPQKTGKMLPENKKALNNILKIVEEKEELTFSEIYKIVNKKPAYFHCVLKKLTDFRSVHYNENVSIIKKNKKTTLIWIPNRKTDTQKVEIFKEREDKNFTEKENTGSVKIKSSLRKTVNLQKKKKKQNLNKPLQRQLEFYPEREGPPRNAREQYEDLQMERYKRSLLEDRKDKKHHQYKRRLLNKNLGEEHK